MTVSSKKVSLFLKRSFTALFILGGCWETGGPARAQSKPAAGAGSYLKTAGLKTAPITMEVFSDFQCPSCRAFYEETLRPLMNDYVAAEKVYLIHRDFPSPMHKYARDAARWADAAARIGKYEQVEAALYDNQAAWSNDGDIRQFIAAALAPAQMKRMERLMEGCPGSATSVTATKMSRGQQANHGCIEDAAIDKDVALGRQIPVRATPTFVVTYKGRRYPPASGAISYPVLKQFFDELMKQ